MRQNKFEIALIPDHRFSCGLVTRLLPYLANTCEWRCLITPVFPRPSSVHSTAVPVVVWCLITPVFPPSSVHSTAVPVVIWCLITPVFPPSSVHSTAVPVVVWCLITPVFPLFSSLHCCSSGCMVSYHTSIPPSSVHSTAVPVVVWCLITPVFPPLQFTPLLFQWLYGVLSHQYSPLFSSLHCCSSGCMVSYHTSIPPSSVHSTAVPVVVWCLITPVFPFLQFTPLLFQWLYGVLSHQYSPLSSVHSTAVPVVVWCLITPVFPLFSSLHCCSSGCMVSYHTSIPPSSVHSTAVPVVIWCLITPVFPPLQFTPLLFQWLYGVLSHQYSPFFSSLHCCSSGWCLITPVFPFLQFTPLLFQWLYGCAHLRPLSRDLHCFVLQFSPDLLMVYLYAVYENNKEVRFFSSACRVQSVHGILAYNYYCWLVVGVS